MFSKIINHPAEVIPYADHRESIYGKTVFIICGKGGPTGKTWLCNQLLGRGHIAIEISEGINYFVDYHDDKNHIYEMPGNQVIVILNKPLLRELETVPGVYV